MCCALRARRLRRSELVVLLISDAAIGRFQRISATSTRTDNVLLEFNEALDMQDEGKKVLPVFLGEKSGLGRDFSLWNLDDYPDIVPPGLEGKMQARPRPAPPRRAKFPRVADARSPAINSVPTAARRSFSQRPCERTFCLSTSPPVYVWMYVAAAYGARVYAPDLPAAGHHGALCVRLCMQPVLPVWHCRSSLL